MDISASSTMLGQPFDAARVTVISPSSLSSQLKPYPETHLSVGVLKLIAMLRPAGWGNNGNMLTAAAKLAWS